MEIRGLTREELATALERTNERYGGNLYIPEVSFRVKRKPEDVEVIENTYTVAASYRVFVRREVFDRTADGEAIKTGEWTEWKDYGYEPWTYNMGDTPEERLETSRKLCEAKVEKLRFYPSIYGDDVAEEYKVELVPEHEKTYTHTIDSDYRSEIGRPLNKRGDAFGKILLRVKSARRIGSRVAQQRYSFFGPLYSGSFPRRIASGCWHAHRDFMREVFAINPDARIKSALADYRGSDDFEEKFPATAYAGGMAGVAPIQDIGDACNCDEGDHPEMATQLLTEEQAELRADILRDLVSDAPYPHGFSQARANAYENIRNRNFDAVIESIKRAERNAA